MIYLRYLLTLPFALLVTLLCWLTNPIVCLFVVRTNGRDDLIPLFKLWQTFDAHVDEGYVNKYWTTPTNYETSALTRYWYRLRWLSRNTGYGWSYLLFSIPRGKGFQWKGISKTYFGYHNDYNIGWRDHPSMPKLDIATRIIGIRKL